MLPTVKPYRFPYTRPFNAYKNLFPGGGNLPVVKSGGTPLKNRGYTDDVVKNILSTTNETKGKIIANNTREELRRNIDLQSIPLYDPDYLTNYSNSKLFRSKGPYSDFPKDDLSPREIQITDDLNKWNKDRRAVSDSITSEGIKKYGEPFVVKDTEFNKRNNLLYQKQLVDKIKVAANNVGIDPVDAMALVMRESGGSGDERYVSHLSSQGYHSKSWNRYIQDSPQALTSCWNSYVDNPKSIGNINDEIYANPKWRTRFDSTNFEPIQSNFGNIARYSLKDKVPIPNDIRQEYLDKLKSVNDNYVPFEGEFNYYKNNRDSYNKSSKYSDLLGQEKTIITNNSDLHNYLLTKSPSQIPQTMELGIKEYRLGGNLPVIKFKYK